MGAGRPGFPQCLLWGVPGEWAPFLGTHEAGPSAYRTRRSQSLQDGPHHLSQRTWRLRATQPPPQQGQREPRGAAQPWAPRPRRAAGSRARDPCPGQPPVAGSHHDACPAAVTRPGWQVSVHTLPPQGTGGWESGGRDRGSASGGPVPGGPGPASELEASQEAGVRGSVRSLCQGTNPIGGGCTLKT